MLTQAQQVSHLLEVRAVHDGLVHQITLLLLCFLRQNVTVVSVMSLDLTCPGEAKSLFRTGVGLYFWHFFFYLMVIYYTVATHIPGVTHPLVLSVL
jgi:hypothetical protein